MFKKQYPITFSVLRSRRTELTVPDLPWNVKGSANKLPIIFAKMWHISQKKGSGILRIYIVLGEKEV